MKALRVHELGEPEAAMRLEDVELPELRAGRVRLRVAHGVAELPDVLMCAASTR
jgi:NADPH2:quinone reductase